MTCKDCLHYGVCYIVENYGDEEANVDGVENDCNEFKDRSRYVVREKGEWVLGHIEPGYFTPGGNRPWMCSKCGRCESWMLDKPKTNFCPNCGSDMRKGENG